MAPRRSGMRAALLAEIASRIPRPERVVMVAVDGCDGAGKSWFADELRWVIESQGREVIRASVDDFHHPQVVRYGRGVDSDEGYWLDAFDYAGLQADLLDPLRPGGAGRYRLEVHDLTSDRPVNAEWLTTPSEAVLLIDGVFLHRDELVDYWDYSVFLDVDGPVRVERMLERDGQLSRLRRHLDAQDHYLSSCRPTVRASVVIDNNDLAHPVISSSR